MTDPARAAAEAAAGLSIANHEVYWDRVESSDGVFDASVLARMATDRDTFAAAGLRLVLEPGLHEPPTYVRRLPNAQYRAQDGSFAGTNVIWSTDVRQRVERYIRVLNATLDFSRYSAIRLGAAGDVEVLYPGNSLFWAFDAVAQATGCPAPGWAPGNTTLDAVGVAAWYDWYLDSLIGEIVWRRNLFRSLGFAGDFLLVMPGIGALPSAARAALDSNLTLYADVMGRGATWLLLLQRLVPAMGGPDRLVAWCSSTAEGYRQDDISAPGDAVLDPSDPVLSTWSSMRLMSYYADRLGLTKGGENPGCVLWLHDDEGLTI